jgi:hypothetical protein
MGVTEAWSLLGCDMLVHVRNHIRRFLPQVQQERQEVFLARYTTASKRKRYEQAFEDYNRDGLRPSDCNVSVFIKKEFIAARDKDPRMIGFRNWPWNAVLGTYIHPMEHHIYNLRDPPGKHYPYLPRQRSIVKGLNNRERAKFIIDRMALYNDPVVYGGDCSRFDKHVSFLHLKLENSIYKHMNSSKELSWMLDSMRTNKCIARDKGRAPILTYGCSTRISGDMQTGLGNSLLTLMMCAASLGRKCNYSLVIDGDDFLVILDRSDSEHADNMPTDFVEMGFTLVLEDPVSEPEHVEFCQSHPVCVRGVWELVRNPGKVLSTFHCSYRYMEEKVRGRYLRVKATCLGIASAAVPVIQSYAEMMVRNTEKYHWLDLQETDPFYHYAYHRLGVPKDVRCFTPLMVGYSTRLSFAKAFGISPTDQVRIERSFQKFEFVMDGGVDLYDSMDWVQQPTFAPPHYICVELEPVVRS